MIKISSHGKRDLENLCIEHYDRLKSFIVDKLDIIDKHPTSPVSTDPLSNELAKLQLFYSSSYSNLKSFASFVQKNNCEKLEKILKCVPDTLTNTFNKLNAKFSLSKRVKVHKGTRNYKTKVMYPALKLIFDYDSFSAGISMNNGKKYSAFDLVKSIGIRTCPYCNRQYITAVEKQRISKGKAKKIRKRPHLDHFYPRSEYPIFGLSFYNLIPSCSLCNSSFKGSKKTTSESHVHPYKEAFAESAKFKFKATSKGITTKIEIRETIKAKLGRVKKSAKLFEIEEVYKSHDDIAKEIYNKSLRNSKEHAEHIKKIISQIRYISASKEEFYQFYFGNYLNEDDFEKRPLAKFTSDLVEDLQIMQFYNKK